jgi:hypothetical protein
MSDAEKNMIPPMTDPLGKYWDQPSTENILLDDTHALMDQKTFEELNDYSCSNPTGAYEGKMWKRFDGSYDVAYLAKGNKPVWMLCWFGASTIGPGYVSNNYRVILIA